jgi:hypothetical protein
MKKSYTLTLLLISSIVLYSQKSIQDKKFKNEEGSIEMAVMIINQLNSTLNQQLTQDISDFLKNKKGYFTNPSFFNTEFVNVGDFEKIFNGENFKINKLHLKDNLDYICLGKYKVNKISKNEFDMFVADISLQINIINVVNGATINSRIYNEKGIGITENDAEFNAKDKLIKQLN